MKSLTTILAPLICGVVFWSSLAVGEDTNILPETLEQRVTRGDPNAFLEAADAGRKDLIPVIEKFPDYNAAKEALAKLGVAKYLGEIVTELTNNTVDTPEPNGAAPSRTTKHSRILAQTDALKVLAYVKNRSTVRVIASLLYAKENPMDYVDGAEPGSTSVWFLEWPSEVAMKTLAQIVDNPPRIDIPDGPGAHDARVKAWQQWWEQNKDKYP